MKTIAIILSSAAILTLGIIVWKNSGTQECENLYNEYTNTVDMPTRNMIFEKGLESGCFHYN